MENSKAERIPVLQIRANGSVVNVIFNGNDGTDVKNRVRDILTEAYEERFQKELASCGQTM